MCYGRTGDQILNSLSLQFSEQVQNGRSLLEAAVELKHHFRRSSHLQTTTQFPPEVATGGLEAIHDLYASFVVRQHADKNFAVLKVAADLNVRDAHHALMHALIADAVDQQLTDLSPDEGCHAFNPTSRGHVSSAVLKTPWHAGQSSD